MKEQYAKFMASWVQRSRRERQLLLIAAAVISIAILWSAHDSIGKERSRLDRALPTASAQLKTMQQQAAELARLANQPKLKKIDLAAQTEEIQTAAKTNNLAVQVKPDGGRLGISGDAPQFNTLIAFLGAIQTSLGMRTETLDVSRSGTGIHFELRLAPPN